MRPVAAGSSCPVCGSSAADFLFRIQAWRYVICRGCRLIRMSPLIEPEPMGEDYTGFDLKTYRKFVRLFRRPQHLRDIRAVRRHAAGGTLLDIGCGTGEFLDVAETAGFQVFGIEPSRIAGRLAAEKHPVMRGHFESLSLKGGAFDVVTLWSVLEHVPRPGPFLARVRSVLRSGGILALRIPVADGLIPQLALHMYRVSLGTASFPLRILFQLDWHYKHYHLFNLRNARILLESAGFKIVDRHLDDSCDAASLNLRFADLDLNPAARILMRAGLGAVLRAASVLGLQDEAVLIARKEEDGRL